MQIFTNKKHTAEDLNPITVRKKVKIGKHSKFCVQCV